MPHPDMEIVSVGLRVDMIRELLDLTGRAIVDGFTDEREVLHAIRWCLVGALPPEQVERLAKQVNIGGWQEALTQ